MRHVLLNLVHDLYRFESIPRLEVIPLLLCCIGPTKHDDSEILWMPSTYFAPDDVVEAYRPSLRVGPILASIRRHDVHVVIVKC